MLLVETDVLFCAGVAHALQSEQDFALLQPPFRDQLTLQTALVGQTNAIVLISDALVYDLTLLARTAQEQGTGLILLTAQQQTYEFSELPAIRGALRRNADPKQLVACLRTVAMGRRWSASAEAVRDSPGARILTQLSPRQVKVMSGVARGAKNVEIARELGTSEQVIKNMLGGIYDLAGVSDRLELALFVLHHPELAEAARTVAGTTETPRKD